MRSLYEKLWDDHVIERLDDGTCLLGVDRSLVYEATSQPALQALRAAGRHVRRPSACLAMADHLVPTRDRDGMRGGLLRLLEEFGEYCDSSGIERLDLSDRRHGIVHIVGPEQGFTQPGMLIASADSHTSSHGALGALAFGIGSTELSHVLATSTLWQAPSSPMSVTIDGSIERPLSAKDVALACLGAIGAGGGAGHAIEFSGPVVERLGMEGRLTLCNMAVEAGSRCGIVAPDEVTFAWLEGRPMVPAGPMWDAALRYWRTLRSDPGAVFTKKVALDLGHLAPQVTWGTSPDQVVPITGRVPSLGDAPDAITAEAWGRALDYMGLEAGTALVDIPIDRVFIGSCTNARLGDLVAAAEVVRGRHLAPDVSGMVVPGSGLVKEAAEAAGLDRIFVEAGFEWRDAGCSMCFASRHDYVDVGQRCASTSNRNFENRQGPGARTHLMSPAMAAAAGVAGHLVDVREVVS
ncbi:MAG: 3-isopropylmalate dehydratase large subunit [Acidimicrobiales bacterium]|nr:3-isopropylmalate dehydratase large subunit [Acidimicrobiales bacterium]